MHTTVPNQVYDFTLCPKSKIFFCICSVHSPVIWWQTKSSRHFKSHILQPIINILHLVQFQINKCYDHKNKKKIKKDCKFANFQIVLKQSCKNLAVIP